MRPRRQRGHPSSAEAVARLGPARAAPVAHPDRCASSSSAVGRRLRHRARPRRARGRRCARLGSIGRMIGATLRNTANPTMLDAGYKANVIPGTRQRHVDGRFLPGQEEEFERQLDELHRRRASSASGSHHDKAVETTFDGAAGRRRWPRRSRPRTRRARRCRTRCRGGTDAKAFERLGIRCFGFSPLRLPPDLDFASLFHGIDERVPVDALQFGVRVLDRFLAACMSVPAVALVTGGPAASAGRSPPAAARGTPWSSPTSTATRGRGRGRPRLHPGPGGRHRPGPRTPPSGPRSRPSTAGWTPPLNAGIAPGSAPTRRARPRRVPAGRRHRPVRRRLRRWRPPSRTCAAGGGAIVVTASLAGLVPMAADPGYSVAKGGVVAFVRSMAPPLAGPGVTVTAICPGLRRHGDHRPDPRRVGRGASRCCHADEVADAILAVLDGGQAGRARGSCSPAGNPGPYELPRRAGTGRPREGLAGRAGSAPPAGGDGAGRGARPGRRPRARCWSGSRRRAELPRRADGAGQYQEKPPLPFTPGLELCGTVVGDGQRVIGWPPAGRGAFAEQAVLAEPSAFAAPAGMPATGRRRCYHLPDRLRRAAPPGRAAGGRVAAGARRRRRRRVGGDPARQGRRRAGHRHRRRAGRRSRSAGSSAPTRSSTTGPRTSGPGQGGHRRARRRRGLRPGRRRRVRRVPQVHRVRGPARRRRLHRGRIPEAPANHVLVKNYCVVGLHWGLYRQVRPAGGRGRARALRGLYAAGSIRPLVSERVAPGRGAGGADPAGVRGTVGKVVVLPWG